MKRILTILFICVSTSIMAQKITPKSAWLEKWENSKKYLLEMAELMPEAFYDFKPTEDQMSFKEQLMHIKGNMDWLSTTYFSEEKFEKKKSPLPESKEASIALLKRAFENAYNKVEATEDEDLEEDVSFFAGPKSKLQILNLLEDHVTHHRGQLVVYLNMKNVKRPRYVGW